MEKLQFFLVNLLFSYRVNIPHLILLELKKMTNYNNNIASFRKKEESEQFNFLKSRSLITYIFIPLLFFGEEQLLRYFFFYM